jgi:hypothetical protein
MEMRLIGIKLPFSSWRRRQINGNDQVCHLLGKVPVTGQSHPIRLRIDTEQSLPLNIIPIGGKKELIGCLGNKSVSTDLPECSHQFVGVGSRECQRDPPRLLLWLIRHSLLLYTLLLRTLLLRIVGRLCIMGQQYLVRRVRILERRRTLGRLRHLRQRNLRQLLGLQLRLRLQLWLQRGWRLILRKKCIGNPKRTDEDQCGKQYPCVIQYHDSERSKISR